MKELIKDRIGEKQLTQCAEMLRVIAHPLRMEIIRLLHEHEKMNVTQLKEKLDIAQPAVSTHLKNMKDRDILEAAREGTTIWYSLKYPQIIQVLDCVENCAQKLPT